MLTRKRPEYVENQADQAPTQANNDPGIENASPGLAQLMHRQYQHNNPACARPHREPNPARGVEKTTAEKRRQKARADRHLVLT